MMSSGDSQSNALFSEVLEEKANAYFRIVKNMQRSLAVLKAFDVERSEPSLTAAAPIQQREDLVAEAAEQVWFFVVQRECIGLPMYDGLFQEYEISEEVRSRLRPKV
jgi:hypothetical protein